MNIDDRNKEIIHAIEKLMSFFSIFNHSLAAEEIYELVGVKVGKEELSEVLKANFKNCGSFWGFKDKEDATVYKQREKAKRLWEIVRRYRFVFRYIPFLKMAAVCNNLAFNAVNDDSDIDLFIIASSNRIFTVKFFSTILFHLLGIRRHGSKIKDRFCLSFFISSEHLSLEPIRIDNDVYLDYWLATLLPVYDTGVYRNFVEANNKGYKKFPNFVIKNFENRKRDSLIKRLLLSILGGNIGNALENHLKKVQLRRFARNKPGFGKDASVLVNERILKFHNRDRRNQYRNEYLALLRSRGVGSIS